MNNIIVVGSRGHAVAVIDAIEKDLQTGGKYRIVGLVDDYRKAGEETFDFPILAGIKDLPQLMEKYSAQAIVIAIGDNFSRWKVAEKIKGLCPTAHFPPIVHPRAIMGMKTVIGEGTFLGAGVLTSPAASIGKFCVLTSGSIFGHHAVMEDFSCIFAQSVVGAYCRIGFGVSISMGVTIGRKVTVGEHTVIGAGSVVVKDLPPHVVAYGVPAKVVRERKAEERHL